MWQSYTGINKHWELWGNNPLQSSELWLQRGEFLNLASCRHSMLCNDGQMLIVSVCMNVLVRASWRSDVCRTEHVCRVAAETTLIRSSPLQDAQNRCELSFALHSAWAALQWVSYVRMVITQGKCAPEPSCSAYAELWSKLDYWRYYLIVLSFLFL